jgi:Tol biopolymer transport system component
VTDRPSTFPKVSPDGKLIACGYRANPDDEDKKVAIIRSDNGRTVRTFDTRLTPDLAWSPDGRSLNYIVTSKGVGNIWSQPIDGGAPSQVTNFNSLNMWGFAWSRDSTLVCTRGFSAQDLVLITDAQ